MSAIETAAPPPLPPLRIGMVIFPRMTLLDLAGPQLALFGHGPIHLLSETLDPVMTDSGIAILPTTTFDDCPPALDILFVPGGSGAFDAVENPRIIRFLQDHGQTARYITSVCTGSILLAAAGLMDGYKATTHWATIPILEEFGVEVVRERVVIDRNRVSGGGVTAGIDFGLTLLAELRGDVAAKCSQLMMEYDPRPPFDSGSPFVAAPEVVAIVNHMLAEPNAEGLGIVRRFRERSLTPA
ncbi:DJ-1/PfpI family protein [uncultured Sphingomonas sp.]|uniref:DJ-1/PfpI family protein n=1 Tax=uncultured Sphingomonas sp. TaxID=158754 RepID=UPI0035CC0149